MSISQVLYQADTNRISEKRFQLERQRGEKKEKKV